jgi:hypothetical protein
MLMAHEIWTVAVSGVYEGPMRAIASLLTKGCRRSLCCCWVLVEKGIPSKLRRSSWSLVCQTFSSADDGGVVVG